MTDQWLFKSETYDNCNCAVNCGCQFSDRHQGVLLRSAAPLAARFKRKHKRSSATIFSERVGSLKRSSEQIERGRKTP
jgi:hypothetical protein